MKSARRFTVTKEPQANHSRLPYYKRKPFVLRHGRKVVCRLTRGDLASLFSQVAMLADPQDWDTR